MPSLDRAMDAGINFIDTAEMYPVNPVTAGDTEMILGNCLKKRGKRDDLVIANKVTGSGSAAVGDNARTTGAVMIEAVENHMPEVIIVDEIGTEAEALACRTIAERGVQLIGTAHGQLLENLIKNPTLTDLVGGVQTVTLGDDEARARGCQKSILERQGPPTFPILIEMHERNMWVAHNVAESVDEVLSGARPVVQLRTRDGEGEVTVHRTVYDMDVSLGTANVSHTLGAMGGIIAPTSRLNNRADSSVDDPYAWAQTIGNVPDKDALDNVYGGTAFKENKKRGKKTRANASKR